MTKNKKSRYTPVATKSWCKKNRKRSYRDLGKELGGVSGSTVRRAFLHHGVEKPYPKRVYQPRAFPQLGDPAFLARHIDKPYSKVAEIVGCSRQAVQQAYQALGRRK